MLRATISCYFCYTMPVTDSLASMKQPATIKLMA